MAAADRSKDLDVFVRDRKLGKTIQASVSSGGRQGDGWSGDPAISDSGRYIAFESTAPNLVRSDPNKKRDVFLRDRVGKTTKILSRRANGKPAYGDSDDPSISGDGKYVAFESEAKFIVAKDNDVKEDVFRRGPLR
jgi:Tol biopolymer transport system component